MSKAFRAPCGACVASPDSAGMGYMQMPKNGPIFIWVSKTASGAILRVGPRILKGAPWFGGTCLPNLRK